MSASLPGASIIVPTFREAPNLRTLVERVFSALGDPAQPGAVPEQRASTRADLRREHPHTNPTAQTTRSRTPVELILVDDDSRDGTEEIVRELSERYPVHLIVRREERGLSGAVLAGFAAAKYERFVVLDADLQHPPEMIPALLEVLDREDCDFVLASRYVSGGAVGKDWPAMRRWGSRLATLLARPLAPLSDPMSGFFALKRATWEQASKLNPIGYKIGLELYVKGRCRRPAEVPIHFAARNAGQSKLGAGVLWRYLVHLLSLYRFRFPRLFFLAVAVAVTVPIGAALSWYCTRWLAQ